MKKWYRPYVIKGSTLEKINGKWHFIDWFYPTAWSKERNVRFYFSCGKKGVKKFNTRQEAREFLGLRICRKPRPNAKRAKDKR